MKASLTNTLVEKSKPQEKPYEVRDTKTRGLILRIQPTGSKSFICEYKRNHRITIGKVEEYTVSQARDVAVEILRDHSSGKDPASFRDKQTRSEPTLREFLDDTYDEWSAAHYPRSDPAGRVRSQFSEFLDMRLTDINLWQIEKHRVRRLKSGVTKRTINRDTQALRGALHRAYKWKVIDHHPLADMERLDEDKSSRVRYLSEKEEERLREALDAREERLRVGRDSGNAFRRERGYRELPDLREVTFADHLKPLVLTAMNTGIRQGELFTLRWADVDLSASRLTVGGDVSKTHQTRHIPLNSEILQVLKDWKSQIRRSAYVFPGKDGGPFDNVRKSWVALLNQAEISDFRWHDLRHHFASRLVSAGVDLNTVRELLGHSDMKMTMRYAHLAPEVKAEAVERLVNGKQESAVKRAHA